MIRPALIRFACGMLLITATPTWAADRCQQCQLACPVTKVCRSVCELKTVTDICYDVVCEEFCVPGRSACSSCVDGCHQSGCSQVRIRRKLVKRQVTRQVPVVRWVVENLCATCYQQMPTTGESAP